MWREWVRRGWCIGTWWGSRRERAHWGDLGVDGWLILGWISKRWDVGIWTGLGWPRIEKGGGRVVKTLLELHFGEKICFYSKYSSFLVINVCNQGKTL